MKFLLHGNAPYITTGYGVQIALLSEQLRDDPDHDVAISCTYGYQMAIGNWHNIRLYGCGYDYISNDRLHMHADHYFGPDPGWIITCIDVWGLENPLLSEYNVAAWVPIDHWLAGGPQHNVAQWFKKTGATPIAMTRFGEQQLAMAGYDPLYVPLSVDTNVYKPTAEYEGLTGRELMTAGTDRTIPEDAFVVGMVAMNKGWSQDRKGFNEAFWAFSMFHHDHPEANAYLYLHTEKSGAAEGQDLMALALTCGIPEHKIVWGGGPGQYHLLTGTPSEAMAAIYTAMDVLLAPSHGEGFCVPLIEAHACGTPTIATNATSQTELVPEGTGWLVEGQPQFDPPHRAYYKVPFIDHIIMRLDEAYEADRALMATACLAHAAEYDSQHVYETYWKPVIAELTNEPEPLALEREPMDKCAVLVPLHHRTEHIKPLIESFVNTIPDERDDATLVFLYNKQDEDVLSFVPAGGTNRPNVVFEPVDGTTFAEKINAGYRIAREHAQDWVLVTGDDVRFHEGWLDAARKLSTEYDVIGTNDSVPPRVRNPAVAAGKHADHFFVRGAYVEEYGACLDGPGVLAPEAYGHWYTDREIIELAKARGVFTPCLDSIVEHLHPGYDGNEAAREADPTYMDAVERAEADEKTFRSRVPLIAMHRTSRAK